MRYGLIAEDGSILKAMPVLFARLVDLGGESVECRRMNGKPDFIANFWRLVKEFQFRYPDMHKVVAICDADSDCPAELSVQLKTRAITRLVELPFPLVFHVIKRELETWWVAEVAAVSSVTGVPIPFPGGNVEESLSDPKSYLIRQLGFGSKVYTPSDAAAIAQRIDLVTLESRCPGFARFARRVKNGRPPA